MGICQKASVYQLSGDCRCGYVFKYYFVYKLFLVLKNNTLPPDYRDIFMNAF